MGCESCKALTPQNYARCKIGGRKKRPHGCYHAPCGQDFDFGDNNTPPKKRRKKRR